ncbi:hypothetical protein ACSD42_002189 [Cronobacter sakazakii]
MSTITRERAQEIFLGNGPEPTASEERELAHIALAALRERAEPVAWTDEQELRDVNERGCGYLFTVNPITPHADPRRVIKLYAEPPAPVAPAVRAEPVAGENLPCPFCGGACDPAGWLSEQTSGPECENCGATAENIEAWNQRTAAPVVPDDTKRLDWLDAQNKRLNEYYGTAYGWKFDANFQRNAMMLNDSNYPVMTVRQAIDEAMIAAPGKEG